MSVLSHKLISVIIKKVQAEYNYDTLNYRLDLNEIVKTLTIQKGSRWLIKKSISEIRNITIFMPSVWDVKTRLPINPNSNYLFFGLIDSGEYKDGILTFNLSSGFRPYVKELNKCEF
jgi:hypothetical protein